MRFCFRTYLGNILKTLGLRGLVAGGKDLFWVKLFISIKTIALTILIN